MLVTTVGSVAELIYVTVGLHDVLCSDYVMYYLDPADL